MLTAESCSLRQRVSVELQETCDFTTESLLNEVRAFLSILSTYEEIARVRTTEQRGHWAGKVLGRSLVIPLPTTAFTCHKRQPAMQKQEGVNYME